MLIICMVKYPPPIFAGFESELVFRTVGLAMPACRAAVREVQRESGDVRLGGADGDGLYDAICVLRFRGLI